MEAKEPVWGPLPAASVTTQAAPWPHPGVRKGVVREFPVVSRGFPRLLWGARESAAPSDRIRRFSALFVPVSPTKPIWFILSERFFAGLRAGIQWVGV